MAIQVPFRRVHLTEDNGHFDLYDTSGPQVIITAVAWRLRPSLCTNSKK